MTEAKKKTFVAPKASVKVSPLETSFEVTIPGADKFGFDHYFKFSISADGSVEINDNVFNNKKQAAAALKAMSEFLSK